MSIWRVIWTSPDEKTERMIMNPVFGCPFYWENQADAQVFADAHQDGGLSVREDDKTVFEIIEHGDRVTVGTEHGGRITGTARIRNVQQQAWVLNCGGSHGTPKLASKENILQVKRNGKVLYGFTHRF